MELLEYWKIVRHRLWLILLLMLICGSSTLYIMQRRAPLYRTTTTLFLNPAASSPVLPFDVSAPNRVETIANTYSEYMQTRSFAQLVNQQMPAPVQDAIIFDNISTVYVNGTQFFRITATHPQPAIAQQLANNAANVLVAENATRQRRMAAQDALAQSPEMQRLSELQTELQNELKYYADRIAALQTEITSLQSDAGTEAADRRLTSLESELSNLRTLRVNVLSSLSQTQATLSLNSKSTLSNVDTAVVLDEAPLPALPIPSRAPEYALLALVAAFVIGVALAIFLEYLDYTIKSPEMLDAIYGMPTQGVIGVVIDRAGNQQTDRELVTVTDPLSPSAEAFRALRTSIQAASLKSPIHSLLITSSSPGEGKSFVAGNLAVTLAKNGRKVILVDADLRKPTQHELFKTSRVPGFVDALVDSNIELSDVLRPTEVDGLRLLTCGSIPPNPAELLDSPRAMEFMKLLSENADLVIYDTPPAATVTDASVLASRTDGVLQVVKAGGTRQDMALRCKAVLEQVNARILGPVLNQVNVANLGYYAYYYYGYYRKDDPDAPAKKSSRWRQFIPRRGEKRPVTPRDAT